MKEERICLSEFEMLTVTPRGFLRGARCTNVNTFGILPHRLLALRGMKPRNSASVVCQNQ